MKIHKYIIALVAVCSCLTLKGQGDVHNCQLSFFPCQLSSIEHNNTTLKALRTEADARKLDNRTGITLADPEVGFKRMWEGAEQSGNLTELTVTQSIDLSTALGHRSRVAREQNLLIDEEYRMARMEILLDAQLTLIDLAYCNALRTELDRRLGHARRVAEAESRRLACGDTDALSYNNILLSLSSLEAEMARVAMERSILITRLTALNGGQEMEELRIDNGQWTSDNGLLGSAEHSNFNEVNGKLKGDSSATCGENKLHPEDNCQLSLVTCQLTFDAWYAEAEPHLPQLAQARQLSALRKGELTLAKSMHLPTLSATYINERHTIGTRSQGVAVGVSIPLWANKNRVRSARTALEAAEAHQTDAELQMRSAFEQEYARVIGLRHTASLYRRALAEANNTALLEKSMDEGHISVLEYLQGIELYYDYLDRTLNAERDYQRALAELEAWRL